MNHIVQQIAKFAAAGAVGYEIGNIASEKSEKSSDCKHETQVNVTDMLYIILFMVALIIILMVLRMFYNNRRESKDIESL